LTIAGITKNDPIAVTTDREAQEIRTISREIPSEELSVLEPTIAFTKCTPPDNATNVAKIRSEVDAVLNGDVVFAPSTVSRT
jgi:hypothetical protein